MVLGVVVVDIFMTWRWVCSWDLTKQFMSKWPISSLGEIAWIYMAGSELTYVRLTGRDRPTKSVYCLAHIRHPCFVLSSMLFACSLSNHIAHIMYTHTYPVSISPSIMISSSWSTNWLDEGLLLEPYPLDPCSVHYIWCYSSTTRLEHNQWWLLIAVSVSTEGLVLL